MKLLLTGATGAAGSAMLRVASHDPSVTSITVLSRRTLPPWLMSTLEQESQNKISTLILNDFLSYPADVKAKLVEHDACIWALGTSSVGMKEEDYTKITVDYTNTAVKALEEVGVKKGFQFVFVSGEGADPEGQSKVMFARVKGRIEKELLDNSNIEARILRPGYFFPPREYPELRSAIRPAWQRALDIPLAFLFRNLIPSQYIPSDSLGKFAVEAAKGRWSNERTFSNSRMRELLADA